MKNLRIWVISIFASVLIAILIGCSAPDSSTYKSPSPSPTFDDITDFMLHPTSTPHSTIDALLTIPTFTNPQSHDEAKETIVYITKSGSKYHVGGCQYLSKSQIETTLGDAQRDGYEPCSKCHPPE